MNRARVVSSLAEPIRTAFKCFCFVRSPGLPSGIATTAAAMDCLQAKGEKPRCTLAGLSVLSFRWHNFQHTTVLCPGDGDIFIFMLCFNTFAGASGARVLWGGAGKCEIVEPFSSSLLGWIFSHVKSLAQIIRASGAGTLRRGNPICLSFRCYLHEFTVRQSGESDNGYENLLTHFFQSPFWPHITLLYETKQFNACRLKTYSISGCRGLVIIVWEYK